MEAGKVALADVDIVDDMCSRRHPDVVSVLVAVPAVAGAGIMQVRDAPIVHDVVVIPIALRPGLPGSPEGESVMVRLLLILVLLLASVILLPLVLVLRLLGLVVSLRLIVWRLS